MLPKKLCNKWLFIFVVQSQFELELNHKNKGFLQGAFQMDGQFLHGEYSMMGIKKCSVEKNLKGSCTYYVINFCPILAPLRNQENHGPPHP